MHQRSELRPSLFNLARGREEEGEKREREEGSPRGAEPNREARKERAKDERGVRTKKKRKVDRNKPGHARLVCTLAQRETYTSRTPVHKLIVREYASFKDVDCNLGSLLAS